VLYSMVFFALLMIGATLALGQLSMHEEVRLLKDLGLATISIFGVLIAVFIGVNLVFKEIDRKTIYVIIPKPIHRSQFIVGKYLGICFTLAILIVVMTSVLFLLMLWHGASPDANIIKAVLMILVEVMVMTAVATLFSSFSTPFLSGFLTLGIFVMGKMAGDLRALTANIDNVVVDFLLQGLSYVVPNLQHFSASGMIAHNKIIPGSYVLFSLGYGCLYITVTLLIAMIIFRRRDFI